jgi:hypothetical protein
MGFPSASCFVGSSIAARGRSVCACCIGRTKNHYIAPVTAASTMRPPTTHSATTAPMWCLTRLRDLTGTGAVLVGERALSNAVIVTETVAVDSILVLTARGCESRRLLTLSAEAAEAEMEENDKLDSSAPGSREPQTTD